MNEEWKDGAEAYLGTTVAGFPNLFLLTGPNTGLGHNLDGLHHRGRRSRTSSTRIRTMHERRLGYVEVRRDAQASYNATLKARASRRPSWSTGGCEAWYTTRDGKNTTLWPGFTFEFRLRTRRFDPAPYDLAPAGSDRDQGSVAPAGRRERSERIRGVSKEGP